MKKLIALALALIMVMSLGACTVTNTDSTTATDGKTPVSTDGTGDTTAAAAPVEISLWTYPIGKWGDQATVNELLASFSEAYPNIKVNVEYLTYQDGDDKVNTAIEGNAAPDLIMEGPERLVANWGAKGKMVDLSDLWTDETKADIEANNAAVAAACKWTDGAYYEYPLCMTTHCMAINKTVFEKAGAMQYINAETHTWTTENFLKAVQAVYDAGYENVGAVFCGGQGGDQGTRAIVNNLYSGHFTNEDFSGYTINTPENIQALETLVKQDGINFDPAIVGGDEITLFRNGTLQMAFCWNIGEQLKSENAEAGRTNNGDEIMFMAFPSDDNVPELCGGIWGFGVFNNGDDAKIEAAKTFIKYMCDENPTAAVKASNFFPVKASVKDVYAGETSETVMNEYSKLSGFLGAYYQVIPGWATARTEWWNMLQKVGAGEDIAAAVAAFDTNANAATAG